jgi:tetratricopeptide (TPR) repeat protein
MRRVLAALAVLALAGAGAFLALEVSTRDRDYHVLIARGDVALRDDQTFAAIEAYSGAIALRPDSMLAYLRRGETYRRRADRNDLDQAARDFHKASILDSSALRPLEELGDVRYQLQQFDRAVEAYARCARLDDRSARVTYKLALARYRDNDVDAALAAVDQAVRLDDRMPDAHYLRGICLRQKARPAEAVVALEKSVAISPASIPAREELADLYGALDRRADELEELQVLAGLDRDRAERQVAVGLAHARARHWDAAVLTLGSALERMPDDPILYRALGQVWLDSAQARNDRVDLSKAREALERVASSPGATSEVLALSGRAALQDGDIATAERTLQQATLRFPVDPQALLMYASVAERQNHLDNARRALIQYGALVSRDAEFVTHAVRVATLSLRLNDLETASGWIDRGLEQEPQNAELLKLRLRVSDRSRPEVRPPGN